MTGIDRRMAARLMAFLVLAGGLLILGGCGEGNKPPQMVTVRCPFDPPEGVVVECGEVRMPQFHPRVDPRPGAQVAVSHGDGPAVTLFYARVRAAARRPLPDAVVVVPDGPGVAGSDLVSLAWGRLAEFREEHDLIFLDPRGTGHSLPDFRCSAIDPLLARVGRVPGEAARACLEGMREAGYDPLAFDTSETASDLNALRKALAIERWSMLAQGYGAVVALEAVSQDATGIRSLIFDSPASPHASALDLDRMAAVQRVYRRLFSECKTQPGCQATFPGLENSVTTLGHRLTARPLPVRLTRPLPGQDTFPLGLGETLALLSDVVGTGDQASGLPALVSALGAVDHGRSDAGGAALLAAWRQALPARALGPAAVAACREVYPWVDVQEARALASMFKPYSAAQALPLEFESFCAALKVPRAPDTFASPPEEGPLPPALLLSGEFDARSPGYQAPLVAGVLKKTEVLEVRSTGHGVVLASACGRSMALAFLASPGRTVDTACLRSIPPLRFRTEPLPLPVLASLPAPAPVVLPVPVIVEPPSPAAAPLAVAAIPAPVEVAQPSRVVVPSSPAIAVKPGGPAQAAVPAATVPAATVPAVPPPVAAAPTVLAALPRAPAPLPAPVPVPAVEGPVLVPSACPFATPPEARAECGHLITSERHGVSGGKKIRLFYALTRSSAPARAEPVLVLNGGPGQPGSDLVDTAWERMADIRRDHDILFVDQRGTGHSEPDFYCRTLSPVAFWHGGFGRADVESCVGPLKAAGYDPAAFNTVESTLDLVDLRHALGIGRWSVLGTSYGTILAMELVRRDGAAVRGVVLNSPTVTRASWLDLGRMEAIRKVYQHMFEDCAADAACNSAYPDLELAFMELARDLTGHPLPFTYTDPRTGETVKAEMTFAKALNILTFLVGSGNAASRVPGILWHLREAAAGRIAPRRELIAWLYMPFWQTMDILAYGLNAAIGCREIRPWIDPVSLRKAASIYIPYVQPDAMELDYDVFCPAMNLPRGPEELRQPVASTVPVLLLTGDYDTLTPTTLAETIAATLPNSRVLRFHGLGHDVMSVSACARTAASSFLGGGLATPPPACMAEVGGPDFHGATGRK